MTENRAQEDEGPIRLKNAQREIRNAYFDNETGLFTLSCVPGAGKSTTTYRIGPEDILRRWVAGDPTPEQHIAIVSFNRDEASKIVQKVCEQLRTIVEHDLSPVAAEVSEAEVELLVQRIQQAPYMGTIDSLLLGVLREFAPAVGFDEMPVVGNDALLKQVHRECYEHLENDESCADRLEALESAYPSGEYVDGVADMFESAVTYCRDRQLSTEAFHQELRRTRDSVYDGEPDSFDDIVAAVQRVVGDDEIGDLVIDEVGKDDRDRLAAADADLYDQWSERIDDFCALLSAYREAYRELTREYGVLSHTDVAYLVTSYLDGSFSESDHVEEVDDDRRERVLQRYRGRLQSLIIDEAQDVSEIQHAALSHLVHPDMRVLACGDILQSIYLWRHADPTLFQTATQEGEYLGVDWQKHCNETATTTYRCAPAVTRAINSVAEPMFADDCRGNVGDLETKFSPLEPARDATPEKSVHVSSFSSNNPPGSSEWVSPEDGAGEADILARHLAKGLADGTFTDVNGDPLGITVLFRRKTRMSEYEAAFAREGLRVRNASEALFDDPAVEAVFAVCDWLAEPTSEKRLGQLVTEANLGVASLEATFERHEWDLDSVLDDAENLTEEQRRVRTGLRNLRDRRDVVEMQPPATFIEDIIEKLALRCTSDGHSPNTDPEQRAANLDALVETITQWAGENQHGLEELLNLVEPYRDSPREGPVQPSVTGSSHDVEFRTIHDAKGDEDDVVAVADPGFDLWSQGPQHQRFVTHGPLAGLAPPTDTGVPANIDLPGFTGGLYDPDADWTRDVGLRWVTARWCDEMSNAISGNGLVGPERLQRVGANQRSEAWRLLYVALTRARDHLLVPLPQSLATDCHRDRWIETLRDGLEYDGSTDSYSLSTRTGPVEVGVNDVETFATREQSSEPSAGAAVTTAPPLRDELDPWVPRFNHPSTMYPLTEDVDEYALPHLLGESLHTAANDVPDELPLKFDELGPEEVGSCLHEILTRLVDRDVDEVGLRSRAETVRHVFENVVHEEAPAIDKDELHGLWTFFEDVVDDFVESRLWSLIKQAERVSVEQPVDGLVCRDGVEIEIHGKVDFVIELPDGDQHIADLKVALTEQTVETTRRYQLQVAAYAYLFDQQEEQEKTVRPAVETVGVETDLIRSTWPVAIVERRLDRLVG